MEIPVQICYHKSMWTRKFSFNHVFCSGNNKFPEDNFLSYGRILTLHYYFLLICILFSISSLLVDIHVLVTTNK